MEIVIIVMVLALNARDQPPPHVQSVQDLLTFTRILVLLIVLLKDTTLAVMFVNHVTQLVVHVLEEIIMIVKVVKIVYT